MKKYFIYQDEKSQKFWNIEQKENKVITCYGRLGTKGQEKGKDCKSVDAALKVMESLIGQKIKKGYIETTQTEILTTKDESKRYFLPSDDIWDYGKGVEDLIGKIEKDKTIKQYKHITIGAWGECDEDCQPILDYINNNKDKFEQVETLFVGDIESEECELSWITQGNYSDILKNLKNLKKLKIKGSNGLVLSPSTHERLEYLEIICGGLPKNVLADLSESKFPNLETLILYMGVEDYGFDGGISDIKLVLKDGLFPKLKNLELVNSEMQDEIVYEVLNSEILSQLTRISFSYGTLTDKGGEMILKNLDKVKHLEKITIEYHYLSKETEKKLKESLPNIKIEDQQEWDDKYRFPMLTE